jgi:hypothetical protein
MNRYLTTTAEDGCIEAWDAWPVDMDSGDVADFVWQFAESPKKAIAQHDQKLNQWRADIDAGRAEQATY